MQGKNEAEQGNNMESEFDSNKRADSPSEETPTTPKPTVTSQNPKYQLFLNNGVNTNGLSGRDADGPGGSGGAEESSVDQWKLLGPKKEEWNGSLESLLSHDSNGELTLYGLPLDECPPRVFNSPYSSGLSLEYIPTQRMSEYKGGVSPALSDFNPYSFNSRSTSPLGYGTLPSRTRVSAYDTLLRRRAEVNNAQVFTSQYSFLHSAPAPPNKKDYIEELTKQLDACQKRNQFLEAESVEMEKERDQIRYEMRLMLVNKEDLLRTNTQLNNELKRTKEEMIHMEHERQMFAERCREMEMEVKEARDMMVEAHTQEYAFNFLQQSLKNKIRDAEENLEKQTLHAKELSEKLWLAERQLEDLEVSRGSKDKKVSDLSSTILRLEMELADALQATTQATTELSLQQKLRNEAQMRVVELEDSLLEKVQEQQKMQELVGRLQGEVSSKLSNREQTLEEEIQLRERLQLQCKQAERTVDELQMELHRSNQAREDLAKQVKQAQEKMIDLETDVEELHESEQKWAAKQKRAIEQNEQLQLKLIQEKDRNEQLEFEKATIERQLREARSEVEELHSSRVQDDVVSRMEGRVRELDNALKTEERNKAVLTNTIGKLERKINELNDQLEEEHRIATEQKDLMNQRIRTLKRQLNEVEEEASRKEAQYRHTSRELAEERETSARLQRQVMDQQLQTKWKDTLSIRQTLDNLRLDLSADEDEDDDSQRLQQQASVTKV
ncbi:cingulin-like protein 1 isoform X2 [Betta splendens]|uniref:Cingulin-like protein 1 isoform X2 n=1 Tax=Betta splendens TaxID=158456 RepID=A0A6P7P3D9_BETSP|nr:cingulin-like protein 1 isoform X2 [Betta splendens]